MENEGTKNIVGKKRILENNERKFLKKNIIRGAEKEIKEHHNTP